MITMNAHADSYITTHKLTHTAYIGGSTWPMLRYFSSEECRARAPGVDDQCRARALCVDRPNQSLRRYLLAELGCRPFYRCTRSPGCTPYGDLL